MLTQIQGGICAPKGFRASGIHCGIRKNKDKKDLALILSDTAASAAAVYTKNLVKGAPIIVTQENIKNGKAIAMLCNSGNANTCNADGIEIAKKMCALLSKEAMINEDDVIIASTGVIGQPLPIEPIKNGMKELVNALDYNGSLIAASAIMTTDLRVKEAAYSFTIEGKECRIGGIAKGSGMIHPNMATMLAFITCDVNISPALLQKALKDDIEDTFNMVSVDGDTSTNDMAAILANARAGNTQITEQNESYDIFCGALRAVTSTLSKDIARDGEGASKLLTCKVFGAVNKQSARAIAKAVICSSLVKAAMFGADANWGRVLCAIGYAGEDIDINKVDVAFKSNAGYIDVCKMGSGIPFSEEIAKQILSENEINIIVTLYEGQYNAVAWGCDLTYDYVKINGDYRT